MNVPAAIMLDTIGANAREIPEAVGYVGVYVTGLGDVPWFATDIARYPHSRIVRIAQGAGRTPAVHEYDMIDVEDGAVTPAVAAQMVRDRIAAGIQWTTVYGTDSKLSQVTAEILKYGHHVWNGHVNYVLADWNLNQGTAMLKLGTLIHGASCVGVQWASPESNPNTMVPGGTKSLSQANVDISVVDANWIPSGGFTGNTPPPRPVVTYHGMLITTDSHDNFAARAVTSTDDTHWQ